MVIQNTHSYSPPPINIRPATKEIQDYLQAAHDSLNLYPTFFSPYPSASYLSPPDLPLLLETTASTAERILRIICTIHNLANVSPSRLPLVEPYLQFLRPSLTKTLREINEYASARIDRGRSWLEMFSAMEDAVGMPLSDRFVVYNNFLQGVYMFLIRSDAEVPTVLLNAKARLSALRNIQGISTERQPGPSILRPKPDPQIMNDAKRGTHWLQKLFSMPPVTRTNLNGISPSYCYDLVQTKRPIIPAGSPTLFSRDFNIRDLNLLIYLNTHCQPTLVVTSHHHTHTFYSTALATSLTVSRPTIKRPTHAPEATHELLFEMRVTGGMRGEQQPWLVLAMETWEDMILMWSAFHAFKCQLGNPKRMTKEEFELAGEMCLGLVHIREEKETRALLVLEDKGTGGRRLQCAVYEGEQQRCTIWTAFISHLWRSSRWLQRVSDHMLLVHGLQLYVFRNSFNERARRNNDAGAFRIHFMTSQAMYQFMAIFDQATSPSVASTTST